MEAVGLRSRLGEAAGAFASNARNPSLRRAQGAFLGAWTAEWAFTVALGIVAYRAGGAAAVGLVGLLRMVPAALVAPLAAPLADRGRRERVLVAVSMVRGIATALAAVVVGVDGPIWVVYLLAILSTVAATLFRPAHSALLPSLCRTGHELASANVVRGLLDSVATLAGPLLAAVVLRIASVTAVFAVAAGASFWAAALLLRVRYEAPPRPAAPARVRLLAEAVEGAREVVRNRGLAVLVGLAAAQAFTRGAFTVFSVVVALDLLGTGDAGVGALTAAVGAGAVVGSLAASLLVGSRRLAVWFGSGVALWGLPFALIGAFPDDAAALALLAAVGVGNALVDLGLFTLMARLAPDDVLGRVFGLLESAGALAVGVGAVGASLLVEAVGVRAALVAIGLVCPVLVVAAAPSLVRLDRLIGVRDSEIDLLRGVPMLRPLPLPSVEQLARRLEPATVPAGAVVVAQGDIGDAYFVIETGEAEVVGDGRVVASLGPGQAFGEIALLRHVPRTATVRAVSDLRLQVLHSDDFLPVVTGFTPSASEAGRSVDAMLDRYAPRQPSAEA